METLVSKRANKIICISEAVKKFMSSKYMNIDQKKLEKIYYGLDFSIYNNNKNSLKIKKLRKKLNKKIVIGTISRLVPQKRIDNMIKAFKLYNFKYEKNSYLLIVGKGPLKKKLTLQAKNLKINSNIIWIDYLDDIRGFFKTIDIFCLTSEYEGFGIVTLEAFHNRKPVICTHAGSLPEIVKNKYNGICLKKNEIKNLPFYFNYLMNKGNRNSIIKNAHKTLKTSFTNNKMFKNTDKIYRAN